MMTLEEAISHAEEVAQKNEDFVRCHSCDRELGFVKRCQKCAEEQRQLAEWLKELKELKERRAQDVPDTNVGDMISRRDAIDVAFDIFPDDEYFREQFVKGIEALPSAQPESCEGCIQYGLWENEIEYGYPSPCTRCKRRANDNYER